MNRKGTVYYNLEAAGTIAETEAGYSFQYHEQYTKKPENKPVSLTLPLQEEAYKSNVLFPFFDGLIPEGWLLHIAEENWKINSRDRMGLLLTCCKDAIGVVSIKEESDEKL